MITSPNVKTWLMIFSTCIRWNVINLRRFFSLNILNLSPSVCEHLTVKLSTVGIEYTTNDEGSPCKVNGYPSISASPCIDVSVILGTSSPISISLTSSSSNSYDFLETCQRFLTNWATYSKNRTSMVVTIVGLACMLSHITDELEVIREELD